MFPISEFSLLSWNMLIYNPLGFLLACFIPFEQPDLVEGVPAHAGRLELDDL